MGEPCYNCKCPAYSTKDRIAGKCTFSPDCGDFIGYDNTTTMAKSNRSSNLPCYNDNCAAVFQYSKITGCPFSDTCPDLIPIGFGSAKKKTNFDKIKSYSLDEFINVFAPVGCPPTTDYKESCNMNRTCQDCWRDYLTKEVK